MSIHLSRKSFQLRHLCRGLWILVGRISLVAFAGMLLVGNPANGYADPIKRKLLEHEDPVYPAQAKKMKIEGAVILRIVIDPDGRVSDVKVASGNALLLDAASAAAKHWKYSVAAESSVSVVQVTFSLGK